MKLNHVCTFCMITFLNFYLEFFFLNFFSKFWSRLIFIISCHNLLAMTFFRYIYTYTKCDAYVYAYIQLNSTSNRNKTKQITKLEEEFEQNSMQKRKEYIDFQFCCYICLFCLFVCVFVCWLVFLS
jgi:hypothetical protein